ncbi:MAG: hypothetical protein JWN70_6330 [Planctomycetaceae bacterium]|nr:hypothetical protein [Planctomycetaceae bacterium]
MTTQLAQELTKLKHGDHICSIYENAAEQLAVIVPFIIEGINQGARCLYIADERTIEEVAQSLSAAGVNIEHERRRGALRLQTSQEIFLRTGEFVPQAMSDVVHQAEVEALADGFSGLRLAGEMTWALEADPDCDRLIEFEALFDHLLTNSKSVVLCQYNHSRFDAPCIHDVVRTHPLVILGDQICPNPYYELPEMVLRQDQAGTTPEFKQQRVDWWITQLKRTNTAEQDRERALEKLKQSERRFAEAQSAAHIGSWERDLRTNEVTWSDELYRIFGLIPNEVELSYQLFLKSLFPEDLSRICVLGEEAIREHRHFSCDYRIVLADGSIRVVHDQGGVILNEAGEPIRLVGTAQDVTELRQAEQELKRQKVILQTIFDEIPMMINFVDSAGRVQLINKHCERVLGWSLEEAQSRDLVPECYPDPEYRESVMAYIRHPTAGVKELKIRTRDGRMIDTSWIVTWLPDGTHIWFGQDITERKSAEMILRQSEERINLAVQAADLGIFEHDHQTETVYWSPIMRSIFGWGAKAAVSVRAFFDLIHPEDRERIVAAIHQAHSSSGDGLYRVEHRIVRPDGGIRWVSISSRTLFEDGGDARRPVRTDGIVADITGRKRAEQEIREYSESVQALSRRLLEVQEAERRHLARELHDEFGQILATITLHLHAARGLAGPAAHPRLDECAALLQQAGEQVRSLALELRPTMLDTLGLEATLHWLAEQHQQRTGCDVQVVGHLSEAVPSPEIAIACFRVAQEALTNVVRHATARHVWIELNQTESVLELVVRDDGIGFDLIPTQEQAAKRGRLGLLGMAERIQLLGGSLLVKSEPGHGTQISTSFPLSRISEQPEKTEEQV